MPKSKTLIGLSGPSSFTSECVDMVEGFFDADFVMLYHNNPAHIKKWVDRCNAVILAGGTDIHPTVYGESVYNNFNFSKFDHKRDLRELQIIEQCFDTKKPLMGICRGHQILGVKLGLLFMPDISGSMVCHQPGRQNITYEKYEPMHSVTILDPHSFYSKFECADPKERHVIRTTLYENPNEKIWVNSFHHQALVYEPKRKLDGFEIYGTARIDFNKYKEIIEIMGGPHWVSTQWHPEYDWKENSASLAVLKHFRNIMEGSTK